MDLKVKPLSYPKTISIFVFIYFLGFNSCASFKITKNTDDNEETKLNSQLFNWKSFNDDFDRNLLDIIDLNELDDGKRQKIFVKNKPSQRVMSFLNQDDQAQIEEAIRQKLIERLKNMYVKTARSR